MGKTAESLKGEEALDREILLFPLLFVISMDYLLRLMNKTRLLPGFKYYPSCKNIELTYLMFADDLMMFCKIDKTML